VSLPASTCPRSRTTSRMARRSAIPRRRWSNNKIADLDQHLRPRTGVPSTGAGPRPSLLLVGDVLPLAGLAMPLPLTVLVNHRRLVLVLDRRGVGGVHLLRGRALRGPAPRSARRSYRGPARAAPCTSRRRACARPAAGPPRTPRSQSPRSSRRRKRALGGRGSDEAARGWVKGDVSSARA
jgi:hypothetical protein